MYNFDETDKMELKETVNDSLAKEIVAFLNADGGTILVGVNKRKEIIGVKGNIDEVQRKISDVITDSISPRCIKYVRQHVITFQGNQVIEINITPDHSHLYYIKKYGLSERGVYVRDGSSSKPLYPDEIKERYTKTLNVIEPDLTEMPSKRKTLTFQILKNYLVTHNYHYSDSTFEENLCLRTRSGDYNLMAELLADKNDIVINVATFATEDKTKYLKRDEFGGKCLLLAMEQAKNYVESINQTYVIVQQVPRKEKKMFDINAFEQAWINACVHYKWTESNNPGIYIYSNRLEIESYGGIPKGLTKEQFLKGTSKPVNKKLFDIFKTCGFSEESGHGVPTVTSVYGEEAYIFEGDFIKVVIPFDRTGFSNFTDQKHPENIQKTSRKYSTKNCRIS